jgi:hypothetical protein
VSVDVDMARFVRGRRGNSEDKEFFLQLRQAQRRLNVSWDSWEVTEATAHCSGGNWANVVKRADVAGHILRKFGSASFAKRPATGGICAIGQSMHQASL